jgi:hypothetical protein
MIEVETTPVQTARTPDCVPVAPTASVPRYPIYLRTSHLLI